MLAKSEAWSLEMRDDSIDESMGERKLCELRGLRGQEGVFKGAKPGRLDDFKV